MKRELAIAGLALVASILLSSPSIAQTAPPEAEPSTETVEAVAAEPAPTVSFEEMSLDDAILFASTPEERAHLLMRCAGPPPEPAPDVAMSKRIPVPHEG